MSTFDYGRAAATASRLIKKFGVPVTIVATNISPNPGESWKPGVANPLTQGGLAVFLNYDQTLVDGTLIRSGDQKVLLSAGELTFAPSFIGYLQRGSEKWNIVKIEPLNPGDTLVMYTLQVRR